MTRTSALRDAFAARGDEIRAQHAAILTSAWRSRVNPLTALAGAAGLYIFALIDLDVSPARLFGGLGRLIDIAGLMLRPDPGDPLRGGAADPAGDRQSDSLLLRIQHPVGHHHRHRRRRRHRAASVRADPGAGMAPGFVPDPDGADHRRRDRPDLATPAR